MLETLGILHVPRETSQLKGCFSRRIGGKSFIEWVVRRVTDCQQLDGTIVAVGDDSVGHDIAELVPPDVPVFVGDCDDVLDRYIKAIETYPAKSVVSISVDTPFVDPELIDRLVSTAHDHQAFDYISYCSRDGRPAILSRLGIFAEWCPTKALRRAARMAIAPVDRKTPTQFIHSHPDLFRLRLMPIPEEIDRPEMRWTIDREEDWELALDILETLDPEDTEWKRVAGMMDSQILRGPHVATAAKRPAAK